VETGLNALKFTYVMAWWRHNWGGCSLF